MLQTMQSEKLSNVQDVFLWKFLANKFYIEQVGTEDESKFEVYRYK